jgi:hypothetical protein
MVVKQGALGFEECAGREDGFEFGEGVICIVSGQVQLLAGI